MHVLREEGALVEAFAAHPRRHFAVAFARVAGAAGGDDVADGVAAAARDGLNAIFLKRSVGGGAIRAAAPLALELLPLLSSEVVVGGVNATFATSCSTRPSSVRYSHTAKLLHRGHTAAETGARQATNATTARRPRTDGPNATH